MTKEEAINQLQDAKNGYKEYLTNEVLDMAIEALEQEPTTKNDLEVAYNKGYEDGVKSVNICPYCGEYIGAESEE